MATSQVVLVTGANTGIGYETVKALLRSKKTYQVLLGSRTLEKANAAIEKLRKEHPDSTSTITPLQVDLSSDDSIEAAFQQVKNSPGRVDILINNAGAAFDRDYVTGKTSLRACFMDAYDVNVAGTTVLTHIFMPLLLASASPRLIFIAGLSQMTAAAENFFPTPPQPAGWPKKIEFETIGYRCSKTALSMLMLDWNHKLKEDGVKVCSVAPGFLATNLGGDPEFVKSLGAGHPSEGGEIIVKVAEGKRDADMGKIIAKEGLIPW